MLLVLCKVSQAKLAMDNIQFLLSIDLLYLKCKSFYLFPSFQGFTKLDAWVLHVF